MFAENIYIYQSKLVVTLDLSKLLFSRHVSFTLLARVKEFLNRELKWVNNKNLMGLSSRMGSQKVVVSCNRT